MKKTPEKSNQFYRKVNLFFDNELPVKEKRALIESMQRNPDHLALFNREKNFRELLKSRLQEEKPPRSLIQKIKNRIKNEMTGG